MEKTFCFVDESGNKTIKLEHEATPKYFVFTATLVREGDLEAALLGAERIRLKFFQTGEMKSSSIGGNTERRKTILANIVTLPIQIVILAIEKEEILKDSGLKWQKSFFKYASKLLFSKLISSFQPIEILQDEHGDAEFMEEFKRYIECNLGTDLFSAANADYSFSFANSKTSPLIQISDILGGTYLRILSGNELEAFEDYAMRMIQPKVIYIDHWPPKFKHKRLESIPELMPDLSLDENIESYCLRRVNDFLANDSVGRIESEILVQCKGFLRYLLQRLDSGGKYDFVSTKQILGFLSRITGKPINMQHLRTKIVAAIRDQQVIIASGPKGYKIPTCYKDVHSFISHGNSIIPPMVSRLKYAKDAIRIVSFGQRDILASDGFETLKKIIESTDR